MKGYYHWECFVEACRQANRAGAHEIESITISNNVYEAFHSYDTAND